MKIRMNTEIRDEEEVTIFIAIASASVRESEIEERAEEERASGECT